MDTAHLGAIKSTGEKRLSGNKMGYSNGENKSLYFRTGNKLCPFCDKTVSPYGNCECLDHQVFKCEICGYLITPYNIGIGMCVRAVDKIYHLDCTGGFLISSCYCGIPITPFDLLKHHNCHNKVRSCMWCEDRMTPYNPDPYGFFCTSGCHNSYNQKNREPEEYIFPAKT